jgi:hypothetical protein
MVYIFLLYYATKHTTESNTTIEIKVINFAKPKSTGLYLNTVLTIKL